MAETPDAEQERIRQEALRQELEAARRRRDSYQALLKDLPEIFEGRFRERLRPLQQRNEQLQLEGMALREQIRRVLPQAEGVASAPPERQPPAPADAPPSPMAAASAGSELAAAVAMPVQPGPAPEPFPPPSPQLQADLEPTAPPLPQPDLQATPQPQPPSPLPTGAFTPSAELQPSEGLAPPAPANANALEAPLQEKPPAGTIETRAFPPTEAATGARRAPASLRQGQGRPVLPAQGRRGRRHALLLAAAAAVGGAVLIPPAFRLLSGSPAPGGGGRPSAPAAAASVQISSPEANWLEVESAEGNLLHYGLLEGGRSFAIGRGLRLRAGRPDLIRMRIEGQPERALGMVHEIDWHRLEPPAPKR